MKILYIPIGSFCHPKILIRDTNREIQESLPLDFHSTPHLPNIIRVFEELYETNQYSIEFKSVLSKHEGDQLVVSDKNDIYIVHYFYEKDLKDKHIGYPCNIENLKEYKKKEIKEKLEKRFQRLLKYINKKDDIICFLRIENYENRYWNEELTQLTFFLKKFNDYSNKYLIYTNPLVDEKVDFRRTNQFSYQYSIPVLLYKELFTDIEMIKNKERFIKVLEDFESIMSHPNVIEIEQNDNIEKFYIDKEKNQIFKLCDLNSFSFFFIYEDVLYIKTAVYGYQKYLFNKNTNRYVYIPKL